MGTHLEHAMDENSLFAYAQERVHLGRREFEVLGAVLALRTATARQVVEFLDYKDMNCVRPRLTELIKAGRIEKSKKVLCPVTRKTVWAFSVNQDKLPAQPDLFPEAVSNAK